MASPKGRGSRERVREEGRCCRARGDGGRTVQPVRVIAAERPVETPARFVCRGLPRGGEVRAENRRVAAGCRLLTLLAAPPVAGSQPCCRWGHGHRWAPLAGPCGAGQCGAGCGSSLPQHPVPVLPAPTLPLVAVKSALGDLVEVGAAWEAAAGSCVSLAPRLCPSCQF